MTHEGLWHAAEGTDTRVTHDYVSVRDAADALELDRLRLFRLARYMGRAPGDRCIPCDVISRAIAKEDAEERYQLLLAWFLKRLQGDRSPNVRPDTPEAEPGGSSSRNPQ
jgi:hypothetical protein